MSAPTIIIHPIFGRLRVLEQNGLVYRCRAPDGQEFFVGVSEMAAIQRHG